MRTLGERTALLKQARSERLEVKHRHKLRVKHGYGDKALPEQTGDCCILAAVSTRGARCSQGTCSTTQAPSPAAVTGMIRLVRAA